MKELLNQLVDRGEKLLQHWCSISKEEELTLEFKTKASPKSLNLSGDDKQNLGKSLSGFSNSEGGIVVWGVETTTDKSGIDSATKLSPITEIARFKSLVDAQLGQLVSPINHDVSTHQITCASDQQAGYLVLWVGRSEDKPHMSTARNHHRYYRRISEGFRPLENYEIREMLLARRAARLQLETDVQLGSRTGAEISYVIALKLANVSGVMAQFPYFAFKSDGLMQKSLSSPMKALPNADPEEYIFVGGADTVIHCGEKMPIIGLEFVARWVDGSLQVSKSTHHKNRRFLPCYGEDAIRAFLVTGRFGCQDVQATRFECSLNWAELEPQMQQLAIAAWGDFTDF